MTNEEIRMGKLFDLAQHFFARGAKERKSIGIALIATRKAFRAAGYEPVDILGFATNGAFLDRDFPNVDVRYTWPITSKAKHS